MDARKKFEDLVFQQIEEMEMRERVVFVEMNRSERDKVFIELISAKPIRALLEAIRPEDRQGVIDSCLRAWEENRARE